jgi:lipopolysaccharide transport system permease protein
MNVAYRDCETTVSSEDGLIRLGGVIENRSSRTWSAADGFAIGWQIYDPATGLFIQEGEWVGSPEDVPAGGSQRFVVEVRLPPENGEYRVYVSPLAEGEGWFYARGEPLLVVDAEVAASAVRVHRVRPATLRRLRWENLIPAIGKLLRAPVGDLWRHGGLIRSLANREIRSRYRGSLGDVAWTILHPLLLILAYFFVFGIVLESRFGNDPSRSGFALYLLAGMLPWLALSEPLARSSFVVLEHRNFVKKLRFPVEVLPVVPVIAGLVTGLLATAVFLAALILIRGAVHWTTPVLLVILIPQLLFTLGVAWFLAACGVFIRDLAHVMTFLLTLWFFLTPICYPETSLPAALIPVLSKNPVFQFVRGYRLLLLEGQLPAWTMLAKLWLVSVAAFYFGYAWFRKLRRSFADVV